LDIDVEWSILMQRNDLMLFWNSYLTGLS
jgi:hypothetical protein